MPHAAIDPVVLAAMIVIRLQTVVSREVAPGDAAVLTVGSIHAGSTSNVIADEAVLQLNIRTYSEGTRSAVLDAIRRIVEAECRASNTPHEPTFEPFDRFPLTDNGGPATRKVAEAFSDFFGDRSGPLGRWSASEDFSDIPTAFGAAYTYWGIGGTDPQLYQQAVDAERVSQDVPVNHSATFAPVIQPTLTTGTEALVVAAFAWLGAE